MFPAECQLLVRFKDDCVQAFGSVAKAFEKNQGKVYRNEFGDFFHSWAPDVLEEEVLFNGLDLDGKECIKAKKVQYLDAWDVEEELHQEELWEAIFTGFRCNTASSVIEGPSDT